MYLHVRMYFAFPPECSAPMSESMPLPLGCTINNETSVERFFCNLSACNLCSLEFRRSVCCCRMLEEEIVQAECDNMNISFRNATRCGCTSCDDIDATVQVTVLSTEDNTPIPAAQIRRSDSMELLGITLNNGQFIFREPIGTRNITIAVQAPDFLTRNVPINLENGLGRQVIAVTVLLNPHLGLQVGFGGAAVTVRLGPAAVFASAGAFRTSETGQVYEDLVTFQGVVMDMQTGLAGLPSTRFEYADENGTMVQFGIVLVIFLSFQDINGDPLTAEGLRMAITLPDNDGTLLDNEIFLVVYDEATDTWTRMSDFREVDIPGVQKRQVSTTVLEDENMPVDVFAAIAMLVSAECWIQTRTFDLAGNTLPAFVRLEQMSTVAGNEFSYRFGTNTGGDQTTVDGLAQNAVCLPLACNGFTVAFVEARMSFMPTTSASLIPVDFPPDSFLVTDNAPIIIGDMFSIEDVIDRSGAPLPFYPNLPTCRANGMESLPQSDFRDFFSFNLATSETVPATGLCYIKLLIRDCFLNNSVTLNSINSNTGIVDFTNTVLVDEVEPILANGTGGAIDVGPPPRIPCTGSNASPRGVCIEFNCGNIVQAIVRQNTASPTPGLCDLTSLAPILSSPLISGSTSNQQLLIETQILLMTDYNNPDIGLYHNRTTPQMALERCNAGNGSTSSTINILAGYAAEFSCFLR